MTHEPLAKDALLRMYVQGRDVFCPSCSYNLRNTVSQRCPECGLRLGLQIEGAGGNLGIWLLPLLAAAMPLGFCLSVLGIAAHGMGWLWIHDPNLVQLRVADWEILGWLACGSIVYLFALGHTVRRRRQFVLRRVAQRRILALVWVIALFASYVVLLRHAVWKVGMRI